MTQWLQVTASKSLGITLRVIDCSMISYLSLTQRRTHRFPSSSLSWQYRYTAASLILLGTICSQNLLTKFTLVWRTKRTFLIPDCLVFPKWLTFLCSLSSDTSQRFFIFTGLHTNSISCKKCKKVVYRLKWNIDDFPWMKMMITRHQQWDICFLSTSFYVVLQLCWSIRNSS
jgi:hypothetical protein